MRIKWQDKVPYTEVLLRAGMPSIPTILEKAQARWVGHELCMEDQQLPEVLLHGKLADGKCSVGLPRP